MVKRNRYYTQAIQWVRFSSSIEINGQNQGYTPNIALQMVIQNFKFQRPIFKGHKRKDSIVLAYNWPENREKYAKK